MRKTWPAGHPAGVVVVAASGTAVAAIALALHGQAAYVDRIAPAWTPILGAVLALASALEGRHRRPTGLGAAILLLPSAIAGVFHLLRAARAIPLGVDWAAVPVSAGAALTIAATWAHGHPLRRENGLPLEAPRWVVGLGVVSAVVYPGLKTLWAAGVDWLAPQGVASDVDAVYLVPVTLALLGASATWVALRWWDRPAPRHAHGAATAGGLALTGLGLSGLNATLTTDTAEGPAVGLIVYGSWLVWGLATLAAAGRLSPRRGSASSATAPSRLGV